MEQAYRDAIFADLLQQRTHFSGMPYEAHIQFSNYCNMSCIMCWDGRNPPVQQMSDELLERVGDQVAQHLSIITPYSGSEPLLLTWDETKSMAKRYGSLLSLTTNLQFLDEAMFEEVSEITETLKISIDSHVQEIFEKMRPRSNPGKVFRNLAKIFHLCRERELECIVNVVFMTQNAPMLSDTLSYLADLGAENIDVIQLLDINGRSEFYDPLIHFSREFVEQIKQDCLRVARDRNLRLIWNLSECEEHDFRDEGHTPRHPRKQWNRVWDQRLGRFFPSFCINVADRLRIDLDGDVAPCCYAARGELSLGSLAEQPFAKIWNGPEAQDLRRGMFTDDVPSLCRSCRFREPLKPLGGLPFEQEAERILERDLGVIVEERPASLVVSDPEHASRHKKAPTLRIETDGGKDSTYYLAIAAGGECDELHVTEVEVSERHDGTATLKIPRALWKKLRTNLGYWWNVWEVSSSRQSNAKLPAAQCLVRHEKLPRVKESKLRYLDEGELAVCDLGGEKEHGFVDRIASSARPDVLQIRPPSPDRKRGESTRRLQEMTSSLQRWLRRGQDRHSE